MPSVGHRVSKSVGGFVRDPVRVDRLGEESHARTSYAFSRANDHSAPQRVHVEDPKFRRTAAIYITQVGDAQRIAGKSRSEFPLGIHIDHVQAGAHVRATRDEGHTSGNSRYTSHP